MYTPFLFPSLSVLHKRTKLNSVTGVRERTIPTERPPLVSEVSANFWGVTDPYGRILGFLDRSHYFFFQVAPQLYLRGWVVSVPDPLLHRKSGSAGNRTQNSIFYYSWCFVSFLRILIYYQTKDYVSNKFLEYNLENSHRHHAPNCRLTDNTTYIWYSQMYYLSTKYRIHKFQCFIGYHRQTKRWRYFSYGGNIFKS
jgi:hypothetical protein